MNPPELEDDGDRTPWIKIKISLPRHHKVYQLQKLLNLNSRQEAVGFLIDVFIATYTNCLRDGNWSKWGVAGFEETIGWLGTPGDAVRALTTCGFVDPDSLQLHDWVKNQRQAIYSKLRRSSGGPPAYSNGHRPHTPVDDSHILRERTKMLDEQRRRDHEKH